MCSRQVKKDHRAEDAQRGMARSAAGVTARCSDTYTQVLDPNYPDTYMTPTDNFLKKSSVEDLAQFFRGNAFLTDRRAVMTLFQQIRPDDYPLLLCRIYDIAAYEIDGTGITENAAAADIGKFFSSTLEHDFVGAPECPLGATPAEAYLHAAACLRLENFFEQECINGESLPRTYVPPKPVIVQRPH